MTISPNKYQLIQLVSERHVQSSHNGTSAELNGAESEKVRIMAITKNCIKTHKGKWLHVDNMYC